MKPWMFVALSCALNMAYCVLSFTGVRDSNTALILGTAVGAALGFFWMKLVSVLQNTTSIYVYGIMWDTLSTIVFYFMPLLLANVQLNIRNACASVLILLGTLLLKL